MFKKLRPKILITKQEDKIKLRQEYKKFRSLNNKQSLQDNNQWKFFLTKIQCI